MKRVREVSKVLAEMRANGEFARLGVPEPSEAAVEALVRGVEEDSAAMEARLPKPWAEMTQDERDDWLVREGLLTIEQPEPAPAGKVRATIIFFGPPHPPTVPLDAGSIVMVELPNGSWQNNMVAVGAEDGVVYIATQAEYEAARASGRVPVTTAYPAERVKLAEEQDE